jgi:hypothetical protein
VAEPPTTTSAAGSTTATGDLAPRARRFSLRRR